MQRLLRQIVRGARAAVAIAAVVLIVWAFGWKSYRVLTREDDAKGKTQIRVLHWGDKSEDDIVRRLAEDFQNQPENQDVKIIRMNLGQAAAVRTKLQTMFAAGDPPDVFYLGLENVSDLARKNLLADIEDFIAADKARGEPTIDLADFFPAVLKCFRVNGETGEIGKARSSGCQKISRRSGFITTRIFSNAPACPNPRPTAGRGTNSSPRRGPSENSPIAMVRILSVGSRWFAFFAGPTASTSLRRAGIALITSPTRASRKL
ncbi:MAG: extracellular solute-binding protein [Planctomycetes bacterium]|nr:extracellular solute-binding protein [Planctomycetota bacterium]